MLGYKVFGSGLQGLTAEAMCKDVATGLTATGTLQSDALHLTATLNGLSTVAAGTGAILDSQGSAGDTQTVWNGGANAVKVYPPTGASINGLAANAGVLLAPNTACEFKFLSSTQVIAILSA